ncbi:50S ribosomal protein L22 [Candidatus Parcubacteria bacterium]|jgi:large subunit ribosomal protein L22|nr:MAG: 50S ribosomal protein L22 [Candidatus Parcubacteria bacterium]
METIQATLRYLRIAPRKSRLAVNIIKGLSANEAEAQLLLSPLRSRDYLLRLLRSAIANAEHNKKIPVTKLFVKDVYVNQGPKMKRGTPRARGSMALIEKKMSHVTIVLGVREEEKEKKFTIQDTKKAKKVTKKEKKATKAGAHEEGDQNTKTKKGVAQKTFRRKSV